MMPNSVQAQTGSLDPQRMSITGSIVDNYVNITYEMNFDNTGSSMSRAVSWFFGLQSGIRLSNVSLVMDKEVYWGEVIPVGEAIEIYEESVEEGKTAVLVTRGLGGYNVDLNVANNTEATLSIFVEGLLVRNSGLYKLEMPITTSELLCDFNVDLTILSHYGQIAGYGITGLSSFITTDLADGIRIQYSATSLLVPGLLTATYFLERQVGGSQLLTFNNGSQNFFAYLLAPSIASEEDQAPREYVFVIDRSGSMTGTKIDQAKSAFSSMIEDLNEDDIFNIISFATGVDILWSEPYSATTQNINLAQGYVNGLTADGSTNFYGAGLAALETFTEGEYAKVMLFLSDGNPTVGDRTDEAGILNGLYWMNEQVVSISTVAFGNDADESLMANLASQNNGFFVQVDVTDDASTKLLDFYKVWSTPVAGGFSISVTGSIDFFSLQPMGSAPFFNGTEVVICGRYDGGVTIDTTVNYASGAENYVNTASEGGSDYPHIERIWAQYKISWMLETVRLEGETSQLREQIIALAMQYGLVVDGYTGMILVAEEEVETPSETDPTETTGGYDAYTPYPTTAAPTGGTYTQPPPGNFASVDFSMFGLMGGIYLGGAVLVVLFIINKVKQNRRG
jgi:Ca-activated chloride channel family protein